MVEEEASPPSAVLADSSFTTATADHQPRPVDILHNRVNNIESAIGKIVSTLDILLARLPPPRPDAETSHGIAEAKEELTFDPDSKEDSPQELLVGAEVKSSHPPSNLFAANSYPSIPSSQLADSTVPQGVYDRAQLDHKQIEARNALMDALKSIGVFRLDDWDVQETKMRDELVTILYSSQRDGIQSTEQLSRQNALVSALAVIPELIRAKDRAVAEFKEHKKSSAASTPIHLKASSVSPMTNGHGLPSSASTSLQIPLEENRWNYGIDGIESHRFDQGGIDVFFFPKSARVFCTNRMALKFVETHLTSENETSEFEQVYGNNGNTHFSPSMIHHFSGTKPRRLSLSEQTEVKNKLYMESRLHTMELRVIQLLPFLRTFRFHSSQDMSSLNFFTLINGR